MKQYSLLVRVPESYGSAEAQKVSSDWNSLIEKWKAEGSYVLSFPFPGESHTVSGAEKLVKKETVLSDNLKVVSNIVLKAIDVNHALEQAKQCPILPFGGSVEVREVMQPIIID